MIVLGLARLSGRSKALATLLPSVAAFVVACLVFAAASAGLVDGALRTLLPPLAILLPGAILVTGLSEIAAGAMVAGVSRVGYGIVQLLLFALGILAAAALLRVPPEALSNIRVDDLGWWAAPVGLLLVSAGLCLMESIRLSLMPWVVLVLLAAFGAQVLGQQLYGAQLGGFLGGLAASLCAALVELVRPQLPRLVLFLPAFWMLVPGSLGLLSVTELALGPTGSGVGRLRRGPAGRSHRPGSAGRVGAGPITPTGQRPCVGRGAGSALDGGGQGVGPVRLLPGQVGQVAAEVPVRRGLGVDRPLQVQLGDDGGGAQVEGGQHGLLDLAHRHLLGAEALHVEPDRVRLADRVRDLHLAPAGQSGGHHVLGHPAHRVRRGTVHLGRVLAGERPPPWRAMPP